MGRRGIIGVIGGNNQPPNVLQDANIIGCTLAEEGVILLTGGKPRAKPEHVKDAAMQGAMAARPPAVARAISILPSELPSAWIPGHHLIVPTGLTPYQRDPVNGLTPDLLIVLCGGVGTLCELAFAVAAKRPIHLVGALTALTDALRDNGKTLDAKLDEAVAAYPTIDATPVSREQIVQLLTAYLSARSTKDDQRSVRSVAQVAAKHVANVHGPSGFPGIPIGNQISKDEFERLVRQM